MSQLEKVQDELSKEIQKAEDENEGLRNKLQTEEGKTGVLEAEAQAEIADLTKLVQEAQADGKERCRSRECLRRLGR
jgi:hypothetical protein